MNMLALTWHGGIGQIDLGSSSNDKVTWLETAITISLFTDALANDDDHLPGGGNDRRGFWGDISLPENESLGSKLWLLKREKITQSVLNKTHDYIVQALRWLVVEKHLTAVKVDVERGGLNYISFQIQCQLPTGDWITVLRGHQHSP